MRATLSATRRLNFEEETPNKDGRNNSLSRSRTPTPLRVGKMTSEMDRLRLPKRRHDDDEIHVIEEEEYIKKELKEEMIEIDEPDPKRQREDSGIEDDTDDITIVFDNTNKEFPNKRNYSYAGMFEEAGGISGGSLTGTFMRDFAADQHEPVRRPLGCTYDESSKEWFLADSANDAIRILRKDSTRGTAVYCDLKYPSALVVIEPGRYCAVLDHVGIRLYDYRRESFLNLVEHDLRKGFFNCRGLGLTSAGDLVTIKQSQTKPQILFYSTKKQNDLIKSIPYEIPHNLRGHEPRPSFLDIAPCGSKDRMVVTDLGMGTFSLYTLNAKSRELKLEQQFDCVGDTEDKFQFISGAKFDANGELFITDARGHSLKYLSKEGTFIQKVKFDDSFSYVSNFCVNSNNELLVCDRRDGRIKLYQLKAKDKLDLYLDTLLEPANL